MSSFKDYEVANCSCWNCVNARRQKARELIDFAKTGAPPIGRIDAGELELALRDREASFNEDVIPYGTKTEAPREFYGRALPRMQEQPKWFAPLPVVQEPGRHPLTMSMFLTKDDLEQARRSERPESLTDFASEVHRDNFHWWHHPLTHAKLDRNIGELLMLTVSEIAECMEGERKDLMDDHLPHRKMAEVELADAVIRIADILGSLIAKWHGMTALTVEWKSPTEPTPENKGHALLRISRKIANVLVAHSPRTKVMKLAYALAEIEQYATTHGYDLWAAVVEKREYNKHRADHKPAARLAAGGKKW